MICIVSRQLRGVNAAVLGVLSPLLHDHFKSLLDYLENSLPESSLDALGHVTRNVFSKIQELFMAILSVVQNFFQKNLFHISESSVSLSWATQLESMRCAVGAVIFHCTPFISLLGALTAGTSTVLTQY